ncbi:hypothetical protein ES332_A13G128500v1 [Gossypium tomentosum]|uniref:Uncharacterized protein n=1 Tax=Gossypium tomentosum TaxID=34277 RepID=A0A5D2MJS9_GOSTO|nr:hypothetical protein ES332_A13G128500v1 [Gossypium tomentosum]
MAFVSEEEKTDDYLFKIVLVHQAGLIGDKIDVVVKVQDSRIRDLMMTDIRNLQAFALYIQKNDVKFYLFPITKEIEKKVSVFTLLFLAKHIYSSFMYFSDLCKLRVVSLGFGFLFSSACR